MIELGADPNQRSVNNNESALTRAIKQRQTEQALHLISISNAEKIHRPDLAGGTPFHLACEIGLLDIAQALLAASFQIDTPGSPVMQGFSVRNPFYGKTALMVAAESTNVEVVNFLLENGANFNITDTNGSSIIHLVAASREDTSLSVPQREQRLSHRIEIIELLVNAGANINAQTRHGTTAIKMLADTPNFINERLLEALIRLGADVNATDNNGRTPLHAASDWRNQAIARFLLLNGADVNASDNNGYTPLAIALRHNSTALIGLLLSAGAVD